MGKQCVAKGLKEDYAPKDPSTLEWLDKLGCPTDDFTPDGWNTVIIGKESCEET